MKTNRKPIGSYIFIGFSLLFIYIPIISLIVFSFNVSSGRHSSLTRWNEFGFQNYLSLFQEEGLIDAIFITFQIAIISTIVSTIIGTLAAIAISRNKKIVQDVVLSVNNIPVVNPEIITALALLVLFTSVGLSSGFWRLLLAHISFSVSYVIIAVYPKVKNLDPNLIDAAYDLGATPIKTLFKVVLPQLKVAMIAGAMIAFAMSFDDFIISYFVGGNYQNLSVYLYTTRGTPRPTVNALSTIMISFMGIKVVYDYIKNKKRLIEEE